MSGLPDLTDPLATTPSDGEVENAGQIVVAGGGKGPAG